MKFLFINTHSPAAIEYIYNQDPNLKELPFEEQKKILIERLPDISSSFSNNLNKLGHASDYIIGNCDFSQRKWAAEKGMAVSNFSPPHLARRSLILRKFISKFPNIYYFFKSSTYKIILSQIKYYKPEIIFIFDLHFIIPSILKEIRKYVKKIVGFISSPILLPEKELYNYDILISSYPHYVKKFKETGIKSFYLKHAFDPEVFKKIGFKEKQYDCVYIGGLGQQKKMVYPERKELLEKLAKKVKIDFWGLAPVLDKTSSIYQTYHGQAWGKDMYEILAQSKIVINKHISKVAQNYANNLRLYEATGMGAMLITDIKDNLGEIFEIGKEVVVYNSFDELLEKIKYY